tara:strand:+ start:156 stop:410 length:255 start_codon:yes stop_codon:yes gene_type:complete
MDKKYVVRRTEVIADYFVIEGATSQDDANNIFNSMLEAQEEELYFANEETLTSEYEVLDAEESQNYYSQDDSVEPLIINWKFKG